MNKKLSVLALFLILIGGIGGYFTYSQSNQEEVTTEKTVSSEMVEEIEISIDNATVEVLPTSATEIKVQLVTKGVDVSKLNFTTEVEGKKLTVKLKV